MTKRNGFPVEVVIFDRHRIERREGWGDDNPVYAFTLPTSHIWCDSPGERVDSIAWGIGLDPVLIDGNYEDFQQAALYVETTASELRDLIDALQSLYDTNYHPDGRIKTYEESCG